MSDKTELQITVAKSIRKLSETALLLVIWAGLFLVLVARGVPSTVALVVPGIFAIGAKFYLAYKTDQDYMRKQSND